MSTGAEGQSCRLVDSKFNPTSFNMPYNQDNAIFNSENNTLTLRMDMQDGVRVDALDSDLHLYGQYQVEALPSGESGVVTAFYVSSGASLDC